MRGEEAAMAVVGRNHFFRVGWYKFKHFKIKELKDAFEMPLFVVSPSIAQHGITLDTCTHVTARNSSS